MQNIIKSSKHLKQTFFIKPFRTQRARCCVSPIFNNLVLNILILPKKSKALRVIIRKGYTTSMSPLGTPLLVIFEKTRSVLAHNHMCLFRYSI